MLFGSEVSTTTNNNEMTCKDDIISKYPKQDRRQTRRLRRCTKRLGKHVCLAQFPTL